MRAGAHTVHLVPARVLLYHQDTHVGEGGRGSVSSRGLFLSTPGPRGPHVPASVSGVGRLDVLPLGKTAGQRRHTFCMTR